MTDIFIMNEIVELKQLLDSHSITLEEVKERFGKLVPVFQEIEARLSLLESRVHVSEPVSINLQGVGCVVGKRDRNPPRY